MNTLQKTNESIDIVNQIINRYQTKFITILDIGAGIAIQGKHFQYSQGSELWILEGDAKNNWKKDPSQIKGKYHNNTMTFSYYWDLDELKKRHQLLGTTNYHIIDCDNIDIPENVKFDLICSWLSCGFHYPVSTYYDLIKKHSHTNTKLIFDLRILKEKIMLEDAFEITHIFKTVGRKYATCEIKMKE